MNRNRTLVINWGDLKKFGGIESICYDQIKFMTSNGVRVIWLKNKHSITGNAFRTLLDNSNAEIVNVSDNHLFWFKHDKFCITEKEEVVVVSFTVIDTIRSLTLKSEYSNCNITCLYVIPDTSGKYFFIDQYFKGKIAQNVLNHSRKTLSDWNANNLVLFCALLHIRTFEEYYKINVVSPIKKLYPRVYGPAPLNLEELDIRSKRDGQFNIITVGRFDFPHKGYMLGLVRAYGRLKSKYPQLTLTIVGAGHHEYLLKEEIDSLREDYKKDIQLVGEVPRDELFKSFENKHLSVAVAGAASDAARNGVLSLVARNFCDGECEVYGYLPEMAKKTVSKDEGKLVDAFIEEAIAMSPREYVERCVNAHRAIGLNELGQVPNPWYFFDAAKECQEYSMSSSERRYYKRINYLRKLFMLFHIK